MGPVMFEDLWTWQHEDVKDLLTSNSPKVDMAYPGVQSIPKFKLYKDDDVQSVHKATIEALKHWNKTKNTKTI